MDRITLKKAPCSKTILTSPALEFLLQLHDQFGIRREVLLDKRVKRQAEIRKGVLPTFLTETASIRSGTWKVATTPKE